MKENKKENKMVENLPISIDPMGSYTGKCKDPEEKPVQDADDL